MNETVKDCSPLPCTSDSECAAGMVCYTETLENCDTAAPTCPAGADCPAPADAGCQPVTYSGCVPQYLVPCETDADCGAGFNCQVEEDCACGGSTGSAGGSAGSSGSGAEPSPPYPDDAGAEKPAPDADGGAADPAPTPPDAPPSDGGCTCTPSTTKACNLKVIACSVDQGCLPGWTCGANPNGSCFASSDGTTGCTADPPLICLPPYADLGFQYAKGEDASGGGTVVTGTAGTTSTGEPPTADQGGSSAGSAGTASGASKDSSSGTESEDSGGCAVGHARGPLGASLGFAALAFLGLLGARRRRAR